MADAHTCGIRDDGSLWCWGSGGNGELGLGDTTMRLLPEQVGDHDDWSGLHCGTRHTCGIRGEGTLLCWGQTTGGQIGDGAGDRWLPEQVPDP